MNAATTLPTGRRGQFLALAITGVLLLAVWIGVVAPLVDLYAERAIRLDQRRQIASRMEALAGQLPNLQARAKAAERNGPPPITTVAGSSDAIAAASLQNLVRDLATQAGATLSSVENVEAVAEANGHRRIGIRLALNARWAAFVTLLQAIRQSSTPMLVDDMQIHAQRNLAPNVPQNLTTEMTIYAFRDASAAEAKP